MSAPDVPPGLVEAVAEALRVADDDALVETNFGQLSATYDDAARAAVAAVVEHLACPTPCDDDCEVVCHEMHAVKWKRSHDPAICVEVRARIVTPREAQP